MRPRESTTRTRLVVALAFGCGVFAISQTMLVPSLGEIERQFKTDSVGTSSLFSVFLAAGAVTCGIFGRLGDMYGKKRILLIELGFFACGAVVCALARSLPVLIAGRALMGFALAIFALSYAIVGEQLPRDQVAGAVALLGGLLGSGAAVGQGLGGVITDHLGTSAIFWVALATAVPAAVMVHLWVPESPASTRGRVDVVGALLFSLGLAAPLVAISKAPAWGWDGSRTLGLLATGAAVLAVFVLYERRHTDPLLHIPTLMLPRVRATNLATFFVGFGIFGVPVIFTQFFQVPRSTGYGFGSDPSHAGLFFVPGCIAMVAVSPLTGRLIGRVGPKATLVLGAAVGCTSATGMALAHTTPLEGYVWTTLLFTSLAIAFGSMPMLILRSVPDDKSGQSTAMNLIVRNVGSSLGVQVAATFVTSSGRGRAYPSNSGFTHAFALEAAAAGVAVLAALAVPPAARRIRRDDVALRVEAL